VKAPARTGANGSGDLLEELTSGDDERVHVWVDENGVRHVVEFIDRDGKLHLVDVFDKVHTPRCARLEDKVLRARLTLESWWG
jgi:hypothetical protein